MRNERHITCYILCIPFIILGTLAGHAQEDERRERENGELIRERIVTVGDWHPTVSDAVKLRNVPSLYDSSMSKGSSKYTLLPKHFSTDFNPKPIEPARLRIREPLDRLYSKYIKGGIGMYTTPMGEFHFSSERSRDKIYSVHAEHLSSNGGVKGHKDHSGFSDNKLDLRGKWFLRDHSIEADLGYERNVVHFYGFSPELDTMDRLSEDDIKQRFHHLDGKVHLASYFKDPEKFNYDISLGHDHYRDLHNAVENNGRLGVNLRKHFDGELFKLNSLVDYDHYERTPVGYSDTTTTTTRGIVKLNPQIDSKGDKWKVSAGLGVQTNITHTAFFHFYPKAFAKYSLFDDIFIPYVGIDGGLDGNTFRTLSRKNPFLRSDIDLRTSNTKYDLHGGIRGVISSSLTFNTRISERRIENMPLYVNDMKHYIGNRFDVLYDTANVTHISGELAYHKGEKFKLNLKGDYYSYRLTRELHPWHKPEYKVTFTGQYDLQDKFVITADLIYKGARMARSLEPVRNVEPVQGTYPVELDGYLDGNLGVEYRYTSKLSGFLQFNNIAASNYQRWYQYRVQGFQVMGGAKYAF